MSSFQLVKNQIVQRYKDSYEDTLRLHYVFKRNMVRVIFKSTHRFCTFHYAMCRFWKSPFSYDGIQGVSTTKSVAHNTPHVIPEKLYIVILNANCLKVRRITSYVKRKHCINFPKRAEKSCTSPAA